MLRTALQHASVGVERASRSCLPSCSRTVHSGASTSTSSQTSRPSLSRAQVLQFRKEREEKKEIDRRLEELSKPDPVLGHQMNEVGENLWKSSELYQVILSKDEVWGVREDRRGNLLNIEGNEEKTSNKTSENSMPGPKRLNFGLDNEEDRNLLFSDLPSIQLEDRMRKVRDPTMASAEELSFLSEQVQEMEDQEISHVDVLSRVLDLKNASGKGIQVENTRRIIERFGARSEGDERGPDTGSTEVQTAILTYRIRNLYEHLESGSARHDNQNRRSMTLLVHQRVKLLRYLKRKSPARYRELLPRIGIEARAIEGEVVVPGKPKMKIAT